jgi:hypothetical protein
VFFWVFDTLKAQSRNNMNNQYNVKCPECREAAIASYEPAYQEYAGASVQGGETFIVCPSCGFEDFIKRDLSNFNFAENRRGW